MSSSETQDRFGSPGSDRPADDATAAAGSDATDSAVRRPRLLLHVCCGPCLTAVAERLLPEYDVSALWYNPNIDDPAEHDLRLRHAERVASHYGIKLDCAEDDPAGWLEAVKGLEQEPEGGRRCPVCFEYRLRRAAEFAAQSGRAFLATTLTISPHKPVEAVNRIGFRVSAELGVGFVERNFRLAGGFQRSIELSNALGLYRQRFCGCSFARRSEGEGR